MSQLFSGHPQQAETKLREVRDRFDYLEQTNAGEVALSYALDDNQRAYAGEDYEKVLTRVMLALTSLMTDGVDAKAYSLQIDAKQQEIIERGLPLDDANPKASYKQVAVGPYLHGILCEATHGDYDGAERSFLQVASWQPGFKGAQQDLDRVRHSTHSAPGNGVLYVFAFVGRGPYKREVSEIPTSAAMLIADRILSAVGKHSLPPTIAPIKVPQVVARGSRIDGVLVSVEGRGMGMTQTITDVGQLAVQQYEAIYPHVLARAVARRAIKKAAVYAVKDQLDNDSALVSFGLDAAGVVWEAMESADTRCWSLLPDKIQAERIELPAGQHVVSLCPGIASKPCGSADDVLVNIEDGRNTYLLTWYPDLRPVGEPLVSTP